MSTEDKGDYVHSHVIPVDPSLTVEEAWHELCIIGCRATYTGEPSWASVDCDGDECIGINRDNFRRFHNGVLVEEWAGGRRVL